MNSSSFEERYFDWAPAKLHMPQISYGPFKLIETIPWLLLAAVFRGYGQTPALVLPSFVASMFCVVIAFLLAVRRTIELTHGRTNLEKLNFAEQALFVRRVLKWWLGITVLMLVIFTQFIGYFEAFGAFVFGVDGIAFDVKSKYAMLWSPVILILLFFASLAMSDDRIPNLKTVLSGVYHHLRWMLLAFVVIVIWYHLLSPIQAYFRVQLIIQVIDKPWPNIIRGPLMIGYVFTFACLRLWISLMILTWLFKKSCNELSEAKILGGTQPSVKH